MLKGCRFMGLYCCAVRWHLFVYISLSNSCLWNLPVIWHFKLNICFQTPNNTSPSELKMATSNTNQNSTDEFLRDLLECPVCMETIKSVPVYQCTNGHVMCKICIEKLNNCPICRNDSALVRSLKLENIVQRLEGIQPEIVGPATSKPNLQKWGKGSVRVYGTSDGPNQQPHIDPNLQATPRQATSRQATPRQATSRQVTSTQATNNQDEEAALLQGDMVGNRAQCIKNFFKNVGIFFCFVIGVPGLIFGYCIFLAYIGGWRP